MGTLYLWHTLAICETSWVDLGYATATGSWSMLMEDHSEYPCMSKSSSSVLIASSPRANLSSWIAYVLDQPAMGRLENSRLAFSMSALDA